MRGHIQSVLMTGPEMKIDVAATNINVNTGKQGPYTVSITIKLTLTLSNPNPNLNLNPTGKHGLYRVSYEGKLFEKQLQAVASKRACAEDRASLVDDTYAMASAGLLDVSQPLRVRSCLHID